MDRLHVGYNLRYVMLALNHIMFNLDPNPNPKPIKIKDSDISCSHVVMFLENQINMM